MIIPVSYEKQGKSEYAKVFAEIYNSANTLFQENQRCDGDEKIFYKQLEEDSNFIYVEENEIYGFMSWHKFQEYYELTSLYVKREYQGRKAGHQLLTYFEKNIGEDSCILIKVLNNAHWALDFYKKHNYKVLDEEMRARLERWNMTEKAWEKILYKCLEN